MDDNWMCKINEVSEFAEKVADEVVHRYGHTTDTRDIRLRFLQAFNNRMDSLELSAVRQAKAEPCIVYASNNMCHFNYYLTRGQLIEALREYEQRTGETVNRLAVNPRDLAFMQQIMNHFSDIRYFDQLRHDILFVCSDTIETGYFVINGNVR